MYFMRGTDDVLVHRGTSCERLDVLRILIRERVWAGAWMEEGGTGVGCELWDWVMWARTPSGPGKAM